MSIRRLTMQTFHSLFLFFWLCIQALGFAVPAFGHLIRETANTSYDATVAYDCREHSPSVYEDTARPPTSDEKHASGATRIFLGRFADLLAAETTTPQANERRGQVTIINKY